MLGELKKRFDILVYDSDHRPWMLIECKATAINLDEAALQQVFDIISAFLYRSWLSPTVTILLDGRRRPGN